MYKPPIELLVTDIQNQIVKQQEDAVYRAVLHYIPDIDKAELLRALQYDRNQYEKGYADGKRDAMADLVRCKDCKHRFEVLKPEFENGGGICMKMYETGKIEGCYCRVKANDFCSYGERKDGAEDGN